MIAIERDSWVLVSAQVPDEVVEWIAYKRIQLEDPQVVAAYRGLEAAHDWAPDDPRLVELADQLSGWFDDLFADEATAALMDTTTQLDDTVAAMLDAEFVSHSAAWRKLLDLLDERGWVGWTNVWPAPDRGAGDLEQPVSSAEPG
jgi:uncharacterized protein HemY